MGECCRLIDSPLSEPYSGKAYDDVTYSGSWPYLEFTDNITQPPQPEDALKSITITMSWVASITFADSYSVNAGSTVTITGYGTYSSISFSIKLSADGKNITLLSGSKSTSGSDYYVLRRFYTFNITGEPA